LATLGWLGCLAWVGRTVEEAEGGTRDGPDMSRAGILAANPTVAMFGGEGEHVIVKLTCQLGAPVFTLSLSPSNPPLLHTGCS
jgi:hypothetical protein